MTAIEPSNPDRPIDAQEGAVENQPENDSLPADSPRRQILIGSQRDPVAYRAKQRHDWTPIDEPAKKQSEERGEGIAASDQKSATPSDGSPGGTAHEAQEEGREKGEGSDSHDTPPVHPSSVIPHLSPTPFVSQISALAAAMVVEESAPAKPSVRDRFSPEMEDELTRAMDGVSMDDLLGAGSKADEQLFEPNSLQGGQVIAVRRDDVFVEFSGRQQGIVSLRQFDSPPRPGDLIQVVIQRLNPEDSLYELTLPNKAVQVDDWSDLIEGATIEVRVTGHNAGGLECEVNHIRGFIPVSQIALYRVDDLVPFVDQRLACVITEADPNRRNLVLSHRAVLEREREQVREQLLGSLEPGQIREGVVRKLMDFGAFVDLGGIDGLLHISQLAWGRVKHPRDVLHEGQHLKVRVEKVDPETGRISLGYRDLLESPWTDAAMKYPSHTVAKGVVTKLMDFGAFVELEPGIEGLVHISELSHKRIWRASDVVKEGQEVEVLVLSVDTEAQRMSLSIQMLSAPPESAKKDDSPAEAASTKKKYQKPTGPLLGGLGRPTGERFGLKW